MKAKQHTKEQAREEFVSLFTRELSDPAEVAELVWKQFQNAFRHDLKMVGKKNLFTWRKL